MGLSKWLLRMAGWTVEYTVPDYPKCIICVAPHTSNWDFILGELTIRSIGRKAGFLMKESWFRWPLGVIFRAIGGIPVPRKNKKQSLTETIVKKFRESTRLVLAITPEGTRKATAKWHSGFIYIARDAGVPHGAWRHRLQIQAYCSRPMLYPYRRHRAGYAQHQRILQSVSRPLPR